MTERPQDTPAVPEPEPELEDHVDRLLAELRSAYFELFAALVRQAADEATRTTDSDQEALT